MLNQQQTARGPAWANGQLNRTGFHKPGNLLAPKGNLPCRGARHAPSTVSRSLPNLLASNRISHRSSQYIKPSLDKLTRVPSGNLCKRIFYLLSLPRRLWASNPLSTIQKPIRPGQTSQAFDNCKTAMLVSLDPVCRIRQPTGLP